MDALSPTVASCVSNSDTASTIIRFGTWLDTTHGCCTQRTTFSLWILTTLSLANIWYS